MQDENDVTIWADTYLAELGQRETRQYHRHVVEIVLVWLGMFAASGVIWYGVLKAIGAL